MEDRFSIMKWRNEQIYHLRQDKPLTIEDQERYFDQVVSKLFDQKMPNQILFSFIEGEKCIGYGGLVHINYVDKNAEISFIMDTALEQESFDFYWSTYLKILDQIGFGELNLHKIYTYAFDIRKALYPILESTGFNLDAKLKEHCLVQGKFKDVLIHSKFCPFLRLRKAIDSDSKYAFEWANDPVIKKHSFNNSEISWDSHIDWFRKRLNNHNCEYYIFQEGEEPIGSIRFDLENSSVAKISYLISPKFSGKGYGTFLVEEGISKLKSLRKDIRQVYGLVFNQNKPSIRIFEKLEFSSTKENDGIWRFSKNLNLP